MFRFVGFNEIWCVRAIIASGKGRYWCQKLLKFGGKQVRCLLKSFLGSSSVEVSFQSLKKCILGERNKSSLSVKVFRKVRCLLKSLVFKKEFAYNLTGRH